MSDKTGKRVARSFDIFEILIARQVAEPIDVSDIGPRAAGPSLSAGISGSLLPGIEPGKHMQGFVTRGDMASTISGLSSSAATQHAGGL